MEGFNIFLPLRGKASTMEDVKALNYVRVHFSGVEAVHFSGDRVECTLLTSEIRREVGTPCVLQGT